MNHILPFSLFEAASSSDAKFNFNFPEGKFKKDDIPEDKIALFEKDFSPIISQLKKDR